MGVIRALYGNNFAGYSGKHIRFGPNATATTLKNRADSRIPEVIALTRSLTVRVKETKLVGLILNQASEAGC